MRNFRGYMMTGNNQREPKMKQIIRIPSEKREKFKTLVNKFAIFGCAAA